LAVWTGRGDLVSRCAAPVVDESRFKITRIEAADRPLARCFINTISTQ